MRKRTNPKGRVKYGSNSFECECTRSHFEEGTREVKCALEATGDDGFCDNCREFNKREK